MSNPLPAPLQARLESLLSSLSLEEKAGQMTQITIEGLLHSDAHGKAEKPYRVKDPEAFRQYCPGSVLNTPNDQIDPLEWRELIGQLQQLAAESRPKIPILYGLDSIHGANYVYGATLFPQPINQAASWNPDLVSQIAQVTALETRAAGVPWNFSPVLDVARTPLWPRHWETYGEAPHLAEVMGKAAVHGYQGEDLSDPHRVAACLKHFLGYSAPLSGKDRSPAWIPERQLREIFLPPFREAIRQGAASIMVNSGQINGIPVHADPYLLTSLLREELGFEGVVVTDWRDIEYLHTYHRIAPSKKEAVKMAIEAGIDMSMVPFDYSFTRDLVELVKAGEIPESRLDASVRRILKLKFELGLFETPIQPETAYADFGASSSMLLSKEAARESMTLLKNEEEVLPLPRNARVLLTGMAAHAQHILNGGWTHSWQNNNQRVVTPHKSTILTAIRDLIGRDRLRYALGSSYDQELNIGEAVQLAQQVDYVVVCLGENPYTEFPGNINDLSLPKAQLELVEALSECGKPMVAVLVQGRPRLIQEIEPLLEGILYAYLPGDEGGEVIAETLFGLNNPSGKLPFTYPAHPHNLLTYDHQLADTQDPFDNAYEGPLFPFGHGLSYTRFAYRDLRLSTAKLKGEARLQVKVTVENVGEQAGKEVVQLYVRDLYASVAPPLRRLKRFEKINLAPGEKQEVVFSLSRPDLAFVGRDLKWITEEGTFEVQIADLRAEFEWED
jgi:beta-glucosidase